MENLLLNNCPVCKTKDGESLLSLDCGNLDDSPLYMTLRLRACSYCGHIFNVLSSKELEGLNHYYNFEYAPANLNAKDIKGDRPGSSSALTSDRYGHLYKLLSPYTNSQKKVLDVGCAVGGFLDYLSQRGFDRLFGVDMTETYLQEARKKSQYNISYGSAESLPFGNQEFDVIVMEQVLEHLVDPVKAFQEARRTLKTGGIFCVGVPDAARYADFYFFDYYWLLLREHIQHFDIEHLRLLGEQHGFEMLEYQQTTHAVMSDRMIMPNLSVVFRLSETTGNQLNMSVNKFGLKQQMLRYLDQERVGHLAKKDHFAELSRLRRPLYIWGVGREFLYLYESAGLKECNIAGLIDKNQFKQKVCSVGQMKIVDGNDVLQKAEADSVLLITAIAHSDMIRECVISSGFKGRILCFDKNSGFILK